MERPALNKRFKTKYAGVFYRIRKNGEKSYVVRLKNGNEKTIKPNPENPKITEYVAYQMKRQYDEDIRRGEWEEETKSERMTFQDLIELYLQQNQLTPAIRHKNENLLKKYVSDKLKKLELKHIKQINLTQESLCIMANENLKNITKKHYLSVICSVVNCGKKNQLFRHNVETRYLPKPRIMNGELVRKSYLNRLEMKLILANEKIKNNEMFFSFFTLLIYTAARGKSVYLLKLRDIDIKARTITIIDTKHGNEKYTIPLDEKAIKRVLQYAENNKLKDDDFLFFPKRERADNIWFAMHQKLLRALKNACKENNLELEGLGLHAIRKGVAVTMRESGVPTQIISKFLNHKSTLMTDTHYAIISQKHFNEELKIFNFDFES